MWKSTPVPFRTYVRTGSADDIKPEILGNFEVLCKIQVITFKVELTRTFFVEIPRHVRFHAIQTSCLRKFYHIYRWITIVYIPLHIQVDFANIALEYGNSVQLQNIALFLLFISFLTPALIFPPTQISSIHAGHRSHQTSLHPYEILPFPSKKNFLSLASRLIFSR